MDEYIEREAAIKAMEKADYAAIANDADSCKVDYLREIIESVPAADVVPAAQWIPADEELPPEGVDVLYWYEYARYFRYGSYNRMYQTFGIGYQFNGHWSGEAAQGQNAKVLAWMPLPEPPKMDGGVEDEVD